MAHHWSTLKQPMRTAALSLTILFCLVTNTFAQVVTIELSPGKMKWLEYVFSVQANGLTNAAQFTVAISSMSVPIHERDYATLQTEAVPSFRTNWIDGHIVLSRNKMMNEKGEVIPKSSAVTNGDSIVYSFVVPNEKLAHTAFLFWTPPPPDSNITTEVCYRIALKPFIK